MNLAQRLITLGTFPCGLSVSCRPYWKNAAFGMKKGAVKVKLSKRNPPGRNLPGKAGRKKRERRNKKQQPVGMEQPDQKETCCEPSELWYYAKLLVESKANNLNCRKNGAKSADMVLLEES